MGQVVFLEAGRRLHIRLFLHMTSGIDLSQPRLYLALHKIPFLLRLLLGIAGHMAKWAIQSLLEALVLHFRRLSAIIHLSLVVLGHWECLFGLLTHRHRLSTAVNHPTH